MLNFKKIKKITKNIVSFCYLYHSYVNSVFFSSTDDVWPSIFDAGLVTNFGAFGSFILPDRINWMQVSNIYS